LKQEELKKKFERCIYQTNMQKRYKLINGV